MARKIEEDRCRIGYLYYLVDPFDGRVMYVGKAANPNSRLVTHISEGRHFRHPPKNKWINDCLLNGRKPIMVLKKIVPYERLEEEEQRLIEETAKTVNLLNWDVMANRLRPAAEVRYRRFTVPRADVPQWKQIYLKRLELAKRLER